jgi:hypothetical protein
MKRLTLSLAAAAALSSAIYYAAQQSPAPDSMQPRIAYALILAAGPAPEAGDSGIALDWPDALTEATATEALVTVPMTATEPAIIRTLATHVLPRADLPDGLTVEVWPDGSHWPCATALPGAAGCEVLRHEPGAEPVWVAAEPCSHLAPGQWRGGCSPRPCSDSSELGVGSSMPGECRPAAKE